MMQLLSVFTSKYLFILAAILPIMNTPGLVPIFLSLTSRNTKEQRKFLARRISAYCFLLLLGSMYIGGYVLNVFGVSLPVVQVAGGMLITLSAWRMLNDAPAEAVLTTDEDNHIDRDQLKQKAFYPLTFPLSVGPGSLSVAITIGASIKQTELSVIGNTVPILASLAAVASIGIFVYWCYLHADKLLKYLGNTGSVVFLRLSAFILLCLGIQIMWEGAGALIADYLRTLP